MLHFILVVQNKLGLWGQKSQRPWNAALLDGSMEDLKGSKVGHRDEQSCCNCKQSALRLLAMNSLFDTNTDLSLISPWNSPCSSWSPYQSPSCIPHDLSLDLPFILSGFSPINPQFNPLVPIGLNLNLALTSLDTPIDPQPHCSLHLSLKILATLDPTNFLPTYPSPIYLPMIPPPL